VELDLGDGTTLFREHQPESGYLGQHSSTMIIGLGQKDSVASLRVRWLSGKLETATQVPAGMLITVYENPADSPTGESFTMEPYRKAPSAQMTRLSSDDSWKSRLLPKKPRSSKLVLRHEGKRVRSERGLTLVTTMATWCAACVTEMPELNALRAAFREDELAMVAVPVDGEDTADKLKRWVEKYEPPYQLLTGIAKAQVEKVNRVILRELRTDAVPATFLTDPTGQVLIARWGVPSISAVRRWLWLLQSNKEHLLARKGP
jgi:thiol-disulfide isomerase/thioredoxin